MNSNEKITAKLRTQDRCLEAAVSGDEALGPLKLLPGKWSNEPNLKGRGWNLIALPFATAPGAGFNYRVLMNQYNETLEFELVDKGVPNRGIRRNDGGTEQDDQLVVTLDYVQKIKQISAEDFPVSGDAGGHGLDIHHEPGLWLNMRDKLTNNINIGRLASIPHGDAVLALGQSQHDQGPPQIPSNVSALPIGVTQDIENNPYLGPYKHFVDNVFKGELAGNDAFPGFSPIDTTNLLQLANQGVGISQTTTLDVDTKTESGGISNIPFIVKQANAVSMKSTFWIQELDELNDEGKPKLRLQYLQVVMLDFFPRRDGLPGLIGWPHISINTMEKVSEPSPNPA